MLTCLLYPKAKTLNRIREKSPISQSSDAKLKFSFDLNYTDDEFMSE